MAEKDDRLKPSGEPSGGENVRKRVARARESITQRLMSVAGQIEQEEADSRRFAAEAMAAEAERQLAESVTEFERRAAEALEGAVESLASRMGQLQGELEQRVELRMAEQALELENRLVGAERVSAERIAAGISEARSGFERLDALEEKLAKSTGHRTKKARKRDIELAKVESSKRVTEALAKLEDRGESLRAEMDARAGLAMNEIDERARLTEKQARAAAEAAEAGDGVANQLAEAEAALATQRAEAEAALATQRAEAEAALTVALESARERAELAEERLSAAIVGLDRSEGEARERVASALGRIEEAMTRIEESEQRIVSLEQGAARAHQSASEAAAMAVGVADVEARLLQATKIEDEAARRIIEAERRLRRTLGDEF